MNSSSTLNLARKWRPTTFESVVGQDLTIRLLKNSLFKQQFFPVYLLAGQRGCGKTTTGRIFAAAVNCSKLDEFSKNPQQPLPCWSCSSCEAMKQGAHPDFIEIDAASHTGVDNVRQIIEGTSFLPHLGRKKVYLIDEAHMLSKAAFNAFLKILEEPPKTVLFMMATTDAHKIIDTVRSRCFQLFFDPVADTVLIDHLAAVCEAEAMASDREGLALIARESEGSVRDALNIVERVRLAHEGITKQAVIGMFGSFEEESIIDLVSAVAQSDAAQLFDVWKRYQLEQRPAVVLWKKIFDCLHSALVVEYTAPAHAFKAYEQQLREISAQMAPARIVQCMEAMYSVEQQFLKTTSPHAMLEMLLLKMCLPREAAMPVQQERKPEEKAAPQAYAARAQVETKVEVKSAPKREETKQPMRVAAPSPSGPAPLWDQFVQQIDTIGDPLFASMIKQGHYRGADAAGLIWQVGLPKELTFFEDSIEKNASAWKQLLETICKKTVDIKFQFNLELKATADVQRVRTQAAPPAAHKPAARSTAQQKTAAVDVSDTAKWEKTHTMLAMFPGTVSASAVTAENVGASGDKIKGSTHE